MSNKRMKVYWTNKIVSLDNFSKYIQQNLLFSPVQVHKGLLAKGYLYNMPDIAWAWAWYTCK